MTSANASDESGQKTSLWVRVTDPKGMNLDNCRAFAMLARPLPVKVSIRPGKISVDAEKAEYILSLSIPHHGEFFIECDDSPEGSAACDLLSHLPFIEVVK